MTCRWNGHDQPRVLPGRHDHDCADAGSDDPHGCQGCLPCAEDHCQRCYREHVPAGIYTCPGCIGDARDDLAEIARLSSALPAEVEHRGIDSEAMTLLGPVADPEAVGHVRASIHVGRIDSGWLEAADHELHPLLVLGTWWEAYAEAMEHTEPGRIEVADAVRYLGRHLHDLAQLPDVPFADFARDLAGCRRHLEQVLHDGEQVETGAPCMTCRVPLRLVRGEREDRWSCPRCRQESTEDQYRFAVAQLHMESAEWLTAAEVQVLTGVTPAALRKRVERGDVRSRRDSGRFVYAAEQIPEVTAQRLARSS